MSLTDPALLRPLALDANLQVKDDAQRAEVPPRHPAPKDRAGIGTHSMVCIQTVQCSQQELQ